MVVVGPTSTNARQHLDYTTACAMVEKRTTELLDRPTGGGRSVDAMGFQSALSDQAARTGRWRRYFVLAATACALALTGCGNPPTTAEQTQTAQAGAATTMPSAATAAPSASPTIVPVATPPSVFGFPERAVLRTPASQSDTMFLGGTLWVDARPVEGVVIAYIGGRECGRGKSFTLPDSGGPSFLVTVASDGDQPGCGRPGAEINMTVNGLAVNDPVSWQPGFQQPLNLVVGPAFAQYRGEFRFGGARVPLAVVPYVDGIVCGKQLNGFQGDGQVGYHVVVDSEELRPGCGRAGVAVTLMLQFKGQPDVVLDVVSWQAGAIVRRPIVDVTVPALAAPSPTAAAAQ